MFKRLALVMAALVIAGLGFVWWYDSTGQRPDPGFESRVELPAYPSGPAAPGGRHPRVAIDEAHRNLHTADGRYRPCAELLRSDGYAVSSNRRAFGAEMLGDVDVLVIASSCSTSCTGSAASTDDPDPCYGEAWRSSRVDGPRTRRSSARASPTACGSTAR